MATTRRKFIGTTALILSLAWAILLFGTAPVWAANITWINAGGGNWSVAANWSPAQVPASADTALITTPGTYTVNVDQTVNVTSLTLGSATGVQTLQVNNNTLTATNSTYSGTVTVNSGGVLNDYSGSLRAAGFLIVQSGGTLNEASQLNFFGPLTNAGTINLTNAALALFNGSGYIGGLVNDGAINLYGASGDRIASFEGSEYLINNGTINAEPGAGTMSISAPAGVLMGTYNAALGTTIDFGGGGVGDPLTVGVPPVLNGPGEYQFASGYLLLTEDAIPNLALTGGTLELGPAFQKGGAITNLTLDGTTLAPGTNQISGTLAATNSAYSGIITVNSGGVLNDYSGSLRASGSLTVQSGGTLNEASQLSVFGPLTNAGTINLTNAVLALFNGSGYIGGLVNDGAINLYGASGDRIASFEGSEYLINKGTINAEPGAGTMSISAPVGVLMGTYNAALGTTIDFSGGVAVGPLTVGAPPVLNGPGEYQFASGYLLLTEDAIPNLTLTGGTLELGPAFQKGGAITNLTLDGTTLAPGTNQISGTLAATNSAYSGIITVNSGGVLNDYSGSLRASGSLTVQSGGTLNEASQLSVFGPLTNAGTINLTNAVLALFNGSGYIGGLVNDGAINLYGASGDRIASFEGSEYLINKGTINAEPGAGTMSISAPVGVLMGTYNAALGTTIDFSGGGAVDPLTVGAPPLLDGPGEYQFASGYLLLTEDAIPNLALTGGTLELGPAFQKGGAITNLTLDGTTLAPGTNQISGTLTVTNSAYSGIITVNSGGVLNDYGGSLRATGSLTIQSGGTLNEASQLNVFGPLTNAGTINLTNAALALFNGSGYIGGLVNDGAINLYGASGDRIASFEGSEYLINNGTISQRPGTGNSSIQAPFITDPGTLDSQEGTLTVSSVTLQFSSVLSFGLNSPTDYGKIAFSATAALAGTVSANLNGGFVPAKGDTFNVLAYPSFSGGFTQTNLPAGTTGHCTYGSTVFSLEITGAGTGNTNQPVLSVQRVNPTTVAISWPTSAGNFNLQTSSNLHSGTWKTISSRITTVGPNYEFSDTAGGAAAFFRLQSL